MRNATKQSHTLGLCVYLPMSLNRLPRLPESLDPKGYLTHAIYGFIISILSILFALLVTDSVLHASLSGILLSTFAGIFKEIADHFEKEGVVDITDALTTSLGGLLAAGLAWFLL